jgi:hypothetical protein
MGIKYYRNRVDRETNRFSERRTGECAGHGKLREGNRPVFPGKEKMEPAAVKTPLHGNNQVQNP